MKWIDKNGVECELVLKTKKESSIEIKKEMIFDALEKLNQNLKKKKQNGKF